jgi:hypothetical protein
MHWQITSVLSDDSASPESFGWKALDHFGANSIPETAAGRLASKGVR